MRSRGVDILSPLSIVIILLKQEYIDSGYLGNRLREDFQGNRSDPATYRMCGAGDNTHVL
eukprot:13926991-Heterocapsa_arctica.AAC.1